MYIIVVKNKILFQIFALISVLFLDETVVLRLFDDNVNFISFFKVNLF